MLPIFLLDNLTLMFHMEMISHILDKAYGLTVILLGDK